ncbi:MAG: TerB family tellurite resistance protein [Planctomycetota bacterium]
MNLDAKARMDLMKFVCSFAWTDLKVTQPERDLVMRIVGRLGLTNAEAERVKEWLRVPPPAEEIDPSRIPSEHKQLFLDAAEATVRADGRVVPAERDQLALFRELLEG